MNHFIFKILFEPMILALNGLDLVTVASWNSIID